jgi:hypothetical protein
MDAFWAGANWAANTRKRSPDQENLPEHGKRARADTAMAAGARAAFKA